MCICECKFLKGPTHLLGLGVCLLEQVADDIVDDHLCLSLCILGRGALLAASPSLHHLPDSCAAHTSDELLDPAACSCCSNIASADPAASLFLRQLSGCHTSAHNDQGCQHYRLPTADRLSLLASTHVVLSFVCNSGCRMRALYTDTADGNVLLSSQGLSDRYAHEVHAVRAGHAAYVRGRRRRW